jgi:hypothetical protein
MNNGRTIFSQVMEFIPHKEFACCVEMYDKERYEKAFSCMDQRFILLVMFKYLARDIHSDNIQ